MSLSPAQIQARKRGVGGSEVMAALGKDSRCTRLELYKRKVGEMPEPDLDDNPRVHWGSRLESAIRDEVRQRLGQEIVIPDTLFHPTHPLLGNPDGWMPAILEGVEIKCCDKHEAAEFGEEDTDQVPVRYLFQSAAYMAITGAQKWHLAALIGGNDFRMYQIHRDMEIEAAMLAGVKEFWSHVQRLQPPDPDTPEDVVLRWPRDLGTTTQADADTVAACRELLDAKAALKSAEAKELLLKSNIQRQMQEHANLVDEDGNLIATWRKAKDSDVFDEARFAKECPSLYAKYMTTRTGSRRFLLKLKGESK